MNSDFQWNGYTTQSQQMEELPSPSRYLPMKVLYLLPQNSAVAEQESSESGVELFLITDAQWKRVIY